MAGALVERDLPAGGTSGQYLKIGTALIPEWAAGDTVSGHAASHQNGGTDEIATATAAANAIPKAGAGGTLAAGWIPQATESAVGGAELATAAEIVTGTDANRIPNVANLKTALASDGMWLTKRTKMPDATTASYFQDFTSTIDGFSVTSVFGTAPVYSGGYLVATRTGTGAGGIKFKANLVASYPAKQLLIKVKASTPTPVGVYSDSSAINLMASANIGLIDTIIVCQLPVAGYDNYIYLRSASGAVNDTISIDAVWIGDLDATTKALYTTGTISEEAARIADQLGDSVGVGQAAYATLTSTGTAPSDGDTVTIGGKVYTFKTTLGTTEGQVLIGDTANAAAALDNLKSAINSTGVSAVHYCAAQHPLVEATTNTDTTQVVAARTTGALGNAITIAESSSQLSWANPDGGTTVLSQGYSDAASKIIGEIQYNIAGSKTRPAAAQVHLTDNTKIGFETTVDVAKDATFPLPAGGTWIWNVYGYGATISSAKRGSNAGGTTLTVAGANASVGYRRYA